MAEKRGEKEKDKGGLWAASIPLHDNMGLTIITGKRDVLLCFILMLSLPFEEVAKHEQHFSTVRVFENLVKEVIFLLLFHCRPYAVVLKSFF